MNNECLKKEFNPQDLIVETLARLAFYRLANDDIDFCNEMKQFMREVKNNNHYVSHDADVDSVTCDQLIEAIHSLYRPYGGKK